MKFIQADQLGAFEQFRFCEGRIPKPAAGEVCVKIAACGVGYADALIAQGRYQVKPSLPYIPGHEVSGWVEAIGEGVPHVRPGDRIVALVQGGFAEYAIASAKTVSSMPEPMSFAQAAAFRINYLTAFHGLHDRATLAPGEVLLIFGAAGGVGAAAVQVGKLLGATVVAVASTQEKRDFTVSIGADATIDTEEDHWRERLRSLCDGRGPDVVFDPVCGALFEPAFRSLAPRGRYLVVGFAGGRIPALPANLPLLKWAALLGVDVRQFMLREPEAASSQLANLLDFVAEGRLVPRVGRVYPFDEYAKALDFASTGLGLGKTVLQIAAA